MPYRVPHPRGGPFVGAFFRLAPSRRACRQGSRSTEVCRAGGNSKTALRQALPWPSSMWQGAVCATTHGSLVGCSPCHQPRPMPQPAPTPARESTENTCFRGFRFRTLTRAPSSASEGQFASRSEPGDASAERTSPQPCSVLSIQPLGHTTLVRLVVSFPALSRRLSTSYPALPFHIY